MPSEHITLHKYVLLLYLMAITSIRITIIAQCVHLFNIIFSLVWLFEALNGSNLLASLT
jgi:hypothetical protein